MHERPVSEMSPTDGSALEKILSIGESAYLLLPHIQSLAITRENYMARWNELGGTENNEMTGRLLETVDQLDFDIPTANQHQQKLRTELTDTFVTIAEQLESDELSRPNGQLDWRRLCGSLFNRAVQEQAEPSRQENPARNISPALRATFACSLMSADLGLRRGFIRSVYDNGLQDHVAWLTDRSGLSIVLGTGNDCTIKRFNNYSGAFKADPEDVELYLSHMNGLRTNEKAAPRKRQRQVNAAYRAGIVDTTLLDAAAEDSRANHGAEHSRIDPYKIERFALQDNFIADQLEVLFPDDDIKTSPLIARLVLMRISNQNKSDVQADDPFIKLRDDIRDAITYLSRPVIDAYDTSRLNNTVQYSPPTTRQAAAQRFIEICRKTDDLRRIAGYVDYTNNHLMFPIRDIWTLAEEGADISNQTHSLLSHVVSRAVAYHNVTGVLLSADELRDGLQLRRRYLLRVAMGNINDFSLLTMRREFSTVDVAKLGNDHNKAGWRVAESDIHIPLAHKKTNDLVKHYDGATLGCPAGRIGREGTKQQGRGSHATNNLIDYMAEIIIDEAYERGLFDLRRYID